MKKKHVLLISCFAVVLSSCLFETDDNGLSSWLSDQGLPDSYKVQTLSIDGLVPVEANAYRDTTPLMASPRTVFGASSKMSHEMALEFGYVINADEFALLKNADSADAYVSFPLESNFYADKNIKEKVFPIKENLKVSVSWVLTRGNGKKFIDSVAHVSDSVWVESLKNWEPDFVFDTTYSVNLKKADTTIYFSLPMSFIDSLATCESGCHLEMRFSAPESENLYRFFTSGKNKNPILRVGVFEKSDSLTEIRTIRPFPITPYRMADVVVSNDCSDCLVLHGGGKDSLVVEYPSEPILNALSEFYGDKFPYDEGDGYDVRQAVVLAQMTFARDDSDGENNLGLPIQVVVGSYLDSSGKEYRAMEMYKLNRKDIVKNGHPNMVFYDGDSLTLQVTQGVRDFINRASDNAKLKVMLRLGYPVLQDKDSTYENYILKEDYGNLKRGDTSYVFLSHFDYARYDFANMMKKPATLKLWLATKRGDEE